MLSQRPPSSHGTQGHQEQEQATTLTGHALVRYGGLTLLFSKDWQPCFWVLRSNKLLVFENEAAWMYNKDTALPKKAIPLTERLSLTPLKHKDYSGRHGPLHYFALDESMEGKMNVVVKFATPDREREALVLLHTRLEAHIQEETRRRIEYSVKVVKDPAKRERIIDNVIMKEHTRAAVVSASAAGVGVMSPSGLDLAEPKGDAV